MRDIYLITYTVKGIKALDEEVALSFYKKTITKEFNTQGYNIKGIYGMNGSGKSGIITSVQILKNILVNSGYLNNPMSQRSLDEIINKKLDNLYISAEFIYNFVDEKELYRYDVNISKNEMGKYVIANEQLLCKKATSKKEKMDMIFKVEDGVLKNIEELKKDETIAKFIDKTTNLLEFSSMSSIFLEKMRELKLLKKNINEVQASMAALFMFGLRLNVYMDDNDNHVKYFLKDYINYTLDDSIALVVPLLNEASKMNVRSINIVSVGKNIMSKKIYNSFEKTIKGLCQFIRIFKPDLKDIEIDRKEDGDKYVCELVMVYDEYKVNVEFESTGIKKLIKLYAYIREMVEGGIVFIDEFDSNLHDVYLCALIEYLKEFGDGQLCFTTHNVGPMDILKNNKNSIDFLSINHKVYSWKKSGNYSPSNLYRNGMIEGSPFNVDAIDFIRAFDTEEDD